MIAIIIGAALGFLSGLGTGGGSLLLLYLTLVRQMPQTEAQMINLLFFLPSALIACVFRIRKEDIRIKQILPAILAGSISAIVFAWFGRRWDSAILRKIFGGLLLITGLRELLYKGK